MAARAATERLKIDEETLFPRRRWRSGGTRTSRSSRSPVKPVEPATGAVPRPRAVLEGKKAAGRVIVVGGAVVELELDAEL